MVIRVSGSFNSASITDFLFHTLPDLPISTKLLSISLSSSAGFRLVSGERSSNSSSLICLLNSSVFKTLNQPIVYFFVNSRNSTGAPFSVIIATRTPSEGELISPNIFFPLIAYV